jgi:CRISPR-associated protein Csb2
VDAVHSLTGVAPVMAAAATVMHLALDPAPPLQRVVEVTDLLRAAALSRLDWTGDDSMLAGKTRDGDCMRGRTHQHAHWLPVTDGRVIAGICLWVPGGLTPAEVTAAGSVRHLAAGRLPGGPLPLLRVMLLPGAHPVPYTGPARAWESLTPFQMPRFPKARRPGDSLDAQVRAELAARGFPEPAEAAGMLIRPGWPAQRPSRRAPVAPHWRVRITFADPVAGPLAIGALSHFGLGIMRPLR